MDEGGGVWNEDRKGGRGEAEKWGGNNDFLKKRQRSHSCTVP